MAKLGCLASSILLTLAVSSETATAQYTGLPFVITPNQDPQVSATLIGLGGRVDVGFPSGLLDDYTPIAGLAVLNYGRLSASVGAGSLISSDLPNELTVGASLGYDFTYPKPLLPTITAQAAVGYTSLTAQPGDVDLWDFPIGLGASWTGGPPNVALSGEFWLAPRLHLRSISVPTGSSEMNVGFGISSGLKLFTVGAQSDFNFGLHAALDLLLIEDPVRADNDNEDEFTVGLGGFLRWNTIH